MTPAAEAQVTALSAALGTALPAASLLLTGSAARGELAEGLVDGGHEVFSDYEFFAVTPHHVRLPLREAARTRVRQMAATFGYRNPLFHVDVGFRARGRLHSLPQDVFTFELKHNARLLNGADVRGLIPAVSAMSLDLRATNEVLPDSLWKMLRLLPEEFVRTRGQTHDELGELTVAYLIARTGLDLTTVLLPRQGVLLPTYGDRLAWVEHHGLAPWQGADAAALSDFLRVCFEGRRRLAFGTTAAALYFQLLAFLRRAFAVIGVQDAVSPFRERPASRGVWWVLMRSMLRIAGAQGGAAAYRWMRQPRKMLHARGQLALGEALAAFMSGNDAGAASSLRGAWELMVRLYPGTALAPPPLLFAEQWLALRERWRAYWEQLCLLARP